jgi:hypothetical protein
MSKEAFELVGSRREPPHDAPGPHSPEEAKLRGIAEAFLTTNPGDDEFVIAVAEIVRCGNRPSFPNIFGAVAEFMAEEEVDPNHAARVLAFMVYAGANPLGCLTALDCPSSGYGTYFKELKTILDDKLQGLAEVIRNQEL